METNLVPNIVLNLADERRGIFEDLYKNFNEEGQSTVRSYANLLYSWL